MPEKSISVKIGATSHAILSLTDSKLTVQKLTGTKTKPTSHHDIPYRSIISAKLTDDHRKVSIAYLEKRKRKPMRLSILEGDVSQAEQATATEWVKCVMTAAYDKLGVKPFRKLMVFVNPFSGRKKGAATFQNRIRPIFEEAGCSLEVFYTTRAGEAREIASTLSLDFDAVITVSGDGVIHEILNGFAQHAQPLEAFALPIAPIPTGSGNGLSLNLLGIEDGFDVVAAALNAIKGRPMKADLFSLTQGEKTVLSFMSQAVGLMAEVDLGTEDLRWMGDSRFIYGLLRGLIKFKPCPVQLSFKLVEKDKEKMAAEFQSIRNGGPSSVSTSLHASTALNESENILPGGLPPLKYLEDDVEDWTTLDDPILYVYAGKGPYVGRDFMAFPVSMPNDGLIDLVAMARSSRGDVLSCIGDAGKGQSYWHPKESVLVHYVKAQAYRVKPLKKKGYLSVDGESFPFEEFHVEVHKGLGTLLSPYGHYAAKFAPKG